MSRDWGETLGRLEAATAFGHTEQWLTGRLASTSEDDEVLRAAAGDLLDEANQFFERCQRELAAAGRCVGLLRAQPAGPSGDTQQAGPAPAPTRPALKLPDWDLRPP